MVTDARMQCSVQSNTSVQALQRSTRALLSFDADVQWPGATGLLALPVADCLVGSEVLFFK